MKYGRLAVSSLPERLNVQLAAVKWLARNGKYPYCVPPKYRLRFLTSTGEKVVKRLLHSRRQCDPAYPEMDVRLLLRSHGTLDIDAGDYRLSAELHLPQI